VASLRLKRAAGRAAARVRGVAWFANELQVQIPDADRRDDDDLRGDVPEALMLDVSVPMTVERRPRDGFVTLTGMAAWHHQREAAADRISGWRKRTRGAQDTSRPVLGASPASTPMPSCPAARHRARRHEEALTVAPVTEQAYYGLADTTGPKDPASASAV
jgi:osmotically-inducible protein OsmY